jgi:histidine triad (HIT) family protein
MASLFSRIIANEIPSYKIYEDDKVYAFLDIHPHTRGHTLLVPKTEVDYFADLSEEYVTALMITSQKIAKALDQATGCKRTQVLIAGRDVPHTHIHLIPSDSIDDIHTSDILTFSDEDMKEIQAKIISYL